MSSKICIGTGSRKPDSDGAILHRDRDAKDDNKRCQNTIIFQRLLVQNINKKCFSSQQSLKICSITSDISFTAVPHEIATSLQLALVTTIPGAKHFEFLPLVIS